MTRKLIAADEDLVVKLTAISSQQGKTFYAFVNEIFQETLHTHHRGRTMQEVVEFYELMETQRTSGTVLTPIDALTYLLDTVGEKEKDRLSAYWYEAGQWYGRYLASRFPSNTLENFGKLLALSRGELVEVQVVQGDQAKVRCTSPLISLEYTRLLKRYVEGAVHSLGYETSKDDSLKGLILLEFKKTK